MTTTPTTIYLNDDLKKELTKELDSLGITLNTYFNIAARQFVLQNHLPFEISDEITNFYLNLLKCNHMNKIEKLHSTY